MQRYLPRLRARARIGQNLAPGRSSLDLAELRPGTQSQIDGFCSLLHLNNTLDYSSLLLHDMRSLIPLHLVQAILALADPTTTADDSPGFSCPAFAGHAGQTPFEFRLGLVHPRCLPGEESVALIESETMPVSAGSFESFEEWKARQQVDMSASAAREAQTRADDNDTDVQTEPLNLTESPDIAKTAAPPPPLPPPGEKKGHRYNYASPDCSSRVLTSSPATQHASSLLHKSKDRYMLTPCKADQHYVVVELCDEIRIQAIEIAVWEFFSGVVRNIKLSVGGEETEDWKVVGDWIGKNVRGVQVSLSSLHTLTLLPDREARDGLTRHDQLLHPARANTPDIYTPRANKFPPLHTPGLPELLRNGVLLPRKPAEGLRPEPDGGIQGRTSAECRSEVGGRRRAQ